MSNCVCDITKSEKDSVPRDCDGTVRVVCTVTHSRDCHLKRPCKKCYALFEAGHVKQFHIKLLSAYAGLRRFSPKWCILQSVSFVCFLISLGGCVGSIAQIVIDTYDYTPFVTKY